uniref:Uncharacterized protein n=1 Tax=Anguilla anguilla TaxID=7936 RepID=A0A0E9SMP4_ANGAN
MTLSRNLQLLFNNLKAILQYLTSKDH